MTSTSTKSAVAPASVPIVAPSSTAPTSNAVEREATVPVSRAHEEQLQLNTKEDNLLLQSVISDQISTSAALPLAPGDSSLVLRKQELWAGTVSGSAALGTVVFNLDPFLGYYNACLNANSSMSVFRDVVYDLELTLVVHALPSFAGELRMFFSRFARVAQNNAVRYSYDPCIIDVSNKETAQMVVTMELPYRAMNTLALAYSGIGVGRLQCFVSNGIVSPTGSVQPVQLHLFAEPRNMRGYNYIHRNSITLQTALQPLDNSIVQDVTARLPVSNVMSPNEVAGRFGYADAFPVTNNLVVGQVVANIDVHPLVYKNTPLGVMSCNYAYFRGSIRYRFSLNISKFQNVSLAFCFVPQGSAFSYGDFESFPFQTVQFDQAHSCEIELAYSAGANWLPTYQQVNTVTGPPPANLVTHNTVLSSAATGSLVVFLHSPLISAAAPSVAPTLLLEVAAGHDFELAHPRDCTMAWQQVGLVQAMNDNVPRSLVNSAGNVYSDLTLPHFVGNITLNTNFTTVLPVSPFLARSGLMYVMRGAFAGWSGTLEFIFEATEPGQCDIRYDPVIRVEFPNAISRATNVPRDGYLAFGDSRANRHTVVRVPFCSMYDYLSVITSGDFGNDFGGGTHNGALLINGDGHYRVYMRAGADFKFHFYNGIHAFPAPLVGDTMVPMAVSFADSDAVLNTANRGASTTKDMTVVASPIVPKNSGNFSVADTQAGLLGLSGLDTVNINGAATDVRELLAEMRKVIPKADAAVTSAGKALVTVEMVTEFLSGPGKLAAMAANLTANGMGAISSVVSEIMNMLRAILEVVTPSYIWNFLKNCVEEAFSEEELAFLYAITIFSGAMAIGVDNPWKIICAISLAGLSIPMISKMIPKLVTQMDEFFPTSAVTGEVASTEALSIGGTVSTLLAMIISFIIPSPTGKGMLLRDLSQVGKDISGIFSGAKAIDEITLTLVQWILDMPIVRKTLGINFDDIAMLAQIDVEAYVEEVRGLMLSDFCNSAMDSEKVATQERLTCVRKKLEQFLSKHTSTSFFLNTTLRKVFDEQEKMHKHSLTYKGHAKERYPPFIFMLFGETRVGKSVFAANFNRSLSLMMGWDADTSVYTRVNSDPYFSGLGHHKILYIDDAHTNITSDGAQSDCATIMAFGTNAPYAPRMASLEDKGRTVNATFGLFVTNIPGAPHDSGIRHIDAYLARRNALVHMVWKDGHTEYQSDFSHADFKYVDPKDPKGSEYLDCDFKKCSVTGKPPLVHSAQQLWEKISGDYVDHLCLQRRLRHERLSSTVFEARPSGEKLSCAKIIASNFDNLDALPITALATATTQGCAPAYVALVTGGLKEYQGVLEMFGDAAVARAVGDIYYVPRTKTFVWAEKNSENKDLFEALQEIAFALRSQELEAGEHVTDVFPWLAQKEKIAQAASAVLALEGSEEEKAAQAEEIYEMFDPVLRSFVRNEVLAILHLRDRASQLDTCGKWTVKRAIATLLDRVPRWFKILLVGTSMGAVVYGLSSYLSGRKEEIKPSVITLLNPPVQYEKEVKPSLAVPLKVPAVGPPVQYEKDVTPSLAVPLRGRVNPVAQYEKDLRPSLALPVAKAVREIATYTPDAVNPIVDTLVCKPESAQESETVEVLFTHRVARVVRQNVNQSAVILSDTELLLNRHFFTTAYAPIMREEVMSITYQGTDGGGYIEEREISPRTLFPVKGKDIVLCKLSKPLPAVRSSWNLLATEAMMEYAYSTAGWLVVRTRKGSLKIISPSAISRRKQAETAPVYFNMDGTSGMANETVCYLDGFDYRAGTTVGDCGAPLILSGMQCRIFGIHTCAFQDGAAYSQYVTREMLEDVKLHPGKLYPWQHGDVVSMPAVVHMGGLERLEGVLARVQAEFPLLDLSKINLEVVKVVPVTEGVRGCCRTSYVKSPIDPYFPMESYREPAILSDRDVRLQEEYDPRISILEKYSTPVSPLNAEILQEVVDHLVVHYRGMHDMFSSRSFLNFEESINGIPGAPFYDRINMHSSPGLPYTLDHYHKKANMFATSNQYHDGSFNHVCLVPRVEERFNTILASARKGQRLDDVIYQEFLKDELLPRKKIYTKPATRGIANPPLDLLLAMRSAFLPFIARVQYNRNVSDCQVGLNALSGLEWTRMIHRLKSNSDLVFDADYSAFDSTIHGSTLDAFADIVNGTMGGTFADILARRTLVSYVYDRVSQVTNVQVRVTQGMASGTPITAVANSVINMIYIRYAWVKLARIHAPKLVGLRNFDENVRMIAYGDDNVVTVKSAVSDWFNLRTIAGSLVEYGIKMTDGQKNTGDAVKPFAAWDDIRFLKRAFVWDENAMLYRSPLDLKTLLDRIRFVKSKSVLEDMMMRIHATMMDAMLHGPEVMSDLQCFINAALKEIKLPPVSYSYLEEYKVWSTAGMVATVQNDVFFTTDINGKHMTFTIPEKASPDESTGMVRTRGPRDARADEIVIDSWYCKGAPPGAVATANNSGLSLADIQQAMTTALQGHVAAAVDLTPLQTAINGIADTVSKLPQVGAIVSAVSATPTLAGLTTTLNAIQHAVASQVGGVGVTTGRSKLKVYECVFKAGNTRTMVSWAGPCPYVKVKHGGGQYFDTVMEGKVSYLESVDYDPAWGTTPSVFSLADLDKKIKDKHLDPALWPQLKAGSSKEGLSNRFCDLTPGHELMSFELNKKKTHCQFYLGKDFKQGWHTAEVVSFDIMNNVPALKVKWCEAQQGTNFKFHVSE